MSGSCATVCPHPKARISSRNETSHHARMPDAVPPVSWPLPDGREATLRPIAPGDFAIESAFLDTLSAETSYNRLFSARHPSAEEIRRWTDIDPAREVAFIVTT